MTTIILYSIYLFSYSLPFDRHDWIVDRNGTEIRYIIDFYTGQQHKYGRHPVAAIAMHLDVRPALDSVQSIFARLDYIYRSQFRPNSIPHVSAANSTNNPKHVR